MTLPVDLVLVRHGQSEGNMAKRLSEAGDHSAFERVFKDRHTHNFRLIELGREQAQQAGRWLKKEYGEEFFHRFYTSEYVRAMETAQLLDLPGATWLTEPYLIERDWGELDKYNEEERERLFARELALRHVVPFLWRPLNGESFAELRFRLDRGFLFTLHRECTEKKVIVVCHGEVMWAFRVILERMPQLLFNKLHLSTRPEDRIFNCQVIHYSRHDPSTGEEAPYLNWMRIVRPTTNPVTDFGWQPIVRQRYTNDELRAIVEQYAPVLT